MKRKLAALLLIFLVMLPLFLIAQEKGGGSTGKEDDKRFYTGGTMGLMFGNKTTVEISPMIGYDLLPKFSVGLGFTYLYYRFKDPYTLYKYNTTILGFRGFLRYLIVEQAFAYAEYETLGLDKNLVMSPNENGKLWIDNLYVGGGYRSALSDNVYGYFMGLFNLSETLYSPYTNPTFRAGIEIRF